MANPGKSLITPLVRLRVALHVAMADGLIRFPEADVRDIMETEDDEAGKLKWWKIQGPPYLQGLMDRTPIHPTLLAVVFTRQQGFGSRIDVGVLTQGGMTQGHFTTSKILTPINAEKTGEDIALMLGNKSEAPSCKASMIDLALDNRNMSRLFRSTRDPRYNPTDPGRIQIENKSEIGD